MYLYLKSINSKFTRAIETYLPNLDFLALSNNFQEGMHDILEDPEGEGIQGSIKESCKPIWSSGPFELILNKYSQQLLKLQCLDCIYYTTCGTCPQLNTYCSGN